MKSNLFKTFCYWDDNRKILGSNPREELFSNDGTTIIKLKCGRPILF